MNEFLIAPLIFLFCTFICIHVLKFSLTILVPFKQCYSRKLNPFTRRKYFTLCLKFKACTRTVN